MKLVRLGDIAQVGAGQGAPQDPSAFSLDGLPFIRAGSLDALCSGGNIESLERINEASARKHGMKLYPKGTIVFAKSGMSATKNRVFVLPKPAYVVSHLATLEVKSGVKPIYLQHLLGHYQVARLIQDPAYPSIGLEQIARIEIELPPLPEQQRIAAILARADRLRRLRRYALELSEGYLQAVFVEMFGDPVRNPKGWEIVELGDIGEVQGGLQLSSRRNELPLQAPYLRVANVYRDRLDLSEIKMISLTEGELERLTLQPGDLLLVEGHGNIEEIGRCAIWDGSVPGCVHQNHLIRVRINRLLATGVYVSRYLNGTAGRSYFRDTSNTTSGLNTISTGIVKCCPLMLPPRIDQERFTLVVSKHERLRAQQREALRQAEQLFAALLDRAFRGEL